MTEREKEEIYQRALRRRRIFRRVLAAVLIGLLAFLLVRCHVRLPYSEREIRDILEERYDAAFTLRPLGGGEYRAASDAWPGLECTVRDVWYEGHWDSLLPMWHFPSHAVVDTLRAAAWNRYAVPILEEYGLEGAEAEPDWQFNSFNAGGGAVVELGTDLGELAAELTEAIERIQGAPVFSDFLERGERIGYWCVPVVLRFREEIPVQGAFDLNQKQAEEETVRETFDLDRQWTEEEIREKLGKMEERLEERLERSRQ